MGSPAFFIFGSINVGATLRGRPIGRHRDRPLQKGCRGDTPWPPDEGGKEDGFLAG